MSKEFGNRVKELRKKHKLTQAKLAEKCDLPHRYIQRVEAGESIPNVEKASLLAHALGTSLSSLLNSDPHIASAAKLNPSESDIKLIKALEENIGLLKQKIDLLEHEIKGVDTKILHALKSANEFQLIGIREILSIDEEEAQDQGKAK